jgi:hypothetical protein
VTIAPSADTQALARWPTTLPSHVARAFTRPGFSSACQYANNVFYHIVVAASRSETTGFRPQRGILMNE